MDGTILGQGSFTSTGAAQTIMIPSGTDFINIYNFTESAVGVTGPNGFKFYWQLGMGTQGIVEFNTAGAVTVDQTTAGAFTIYNPNPPVFPGPNVTLTGFSAAGPAVVSGTTLTTLSAGSVVRFNTLNNQPQYAGIDFSVGYGTLAGGSFSVDYLTSTGSTASTSGNWQLQPYNPLFYPPRRIITKITAASSAVVTLSVDHQYTVGQEIRFSFPGGTAIWENYGILDGQSAIITAVDTATGFGHNTITVNYNTTGFGTFILPITNINAYTPPQVIPFGEDTATALAQNPALSTLGDATFNTGFLGMTLAAGAALPAGVEDDVIYWVAGKSTYGGS